MEENRIANDVHQRADGTWINYHEIDDLPIDWDQEDIKLAEAMSEQSIGPLAHTVLNTYGVPILDEEDISGELLGIDIKDADAMATIKMALMEPFAKDPESNPLELIITPAGEAHLLEVGTIDGGISDIYTKIRSTTYNIPPVSVKVTGKKSRPRREIRDWVDMLHERQDLNSILGGGDLGLEEFNSQLGEAIVWDTKQMVNDCPFKGWDKHAIVTFKDPNLNAWAPNILDNEESIYEVQSPWEKVIGWMWYVDPSDVAQKLTKINIKQQSSVPLLIKGTPGLEYGEAKAKNSTAPYIGELVRRRVYQGLSTLPDPENECYDDQSVEVSCDPETSLAITLPPSMRYTNLRGTQIDNFIKISKVYIVGQHLDMCKSFPIDDNVIERFLAETDDTERLSILSEVVVHVTCNNLEARPYTLEEGADYAIGYNTDTGQICIQLINNAHEQDFGDYGSRKSFFIYPNSALNLQQGPEGGEDGIGIGTIIPNKGQGYLVSQLWAQIELNIPCIEIFDPYGNAVEIANKFRLEIAPIVIVDEPAPIAINGELVDQEDGIVDSDPLTVQPLQDTDYELKMRALNGTQIFETNMATLDEDQTIRFSEKLATLLNTEQGLEINYVCGPNCDPQLGGTGLTEGGVVNSITYSYTDMGSYTISVTEGPIIPQTTLINSVSGGERIKQTETVTANGTVIQDEGNSVRYKVRVDGYGVISADSAVSDVIRVGDTVSVKINNVPVET